MGVAGKGVGRSRPSPVRLDPAGTSPDARGVGAQANDTSVSRPTFQVPGRADEVWVVDDEPPIVDLLVIGLKTTYAIRGFGSIEEADQALASGEPAVLICDHYLPGELGLDYLTRIQRTHPGIQRILMSGRGDMALLSRAINEGAVIHFLEKPFDLSTVRNAVAAAAEARRRWAESVQIRERFEAARAAEESAQRRLGARLWRIWRLTRASSLAVLMLAGLALGLGIAVLLVLYALKTLFGFDIFEQLHLSSFF